MTHISYLLFQKRHLRCSGVPSAQTIRTHRNSGNYAQILFIDFKSAFNALQRHVMIDKLQKLEVPTALVLWILSFLSNHPQGVRMDNTKSPVLVSNTGVSQDCVLSTFLYTLYSNDCRSVDTYTMFVSFF